MKQLLSAGRMGGAMVLAFFFLFSPVTPSLANIEQIKEYKKAFPDEKPKCGHCHVDDKPKKEAGAHDPNEYGKKVIAAKQAEKPDAETYKAVGPNPDIE